jgi:hypothetical protein
MKSIFSAVPVGKEAWFEKFLRFGFISKGIIYCLMGVLAVLAAAGLGAKNPSKGEAFEVIYEQPFGKVILALLVVGMLGYVTLRIFQCVKDSDNKGDSMKGIATRAGYGFSALIYMGLGIYVVKLLTNGPGGEGDSRQFVVTKILAWPAGEWIIGIAALIMIGSAINQIYKGISKNFMKKITLLKSNMEEWFKRTGVVGYISRGIVLGIVGYLLLHAALTHNPKEAKGSEQAFQFIENTFGSFLMGVVAAGLVAYGVFMFVKARYQKISASF